MGVMKMLFGNYSKRELKRIQPICDQVLALEDKCLTQNCKRKLPH